MGRPDFELLAAHCIDFYGPTVLSHQFTARLWAVPKDADERIAALQRLGSGCGSQPFIVELIRLIDPGEDTAWFPWRAPDRVVEPSR